MVGFFSNHEMLVNGGDAMAPKDLRRVDLDTGAATLIHSGYLTIAALDPQSGAVVFTTPQPMPGSTGDLLGQGVWRAAPGQAAELVRSGDWNQVFWSVPIYSFVVGGTTQDGSLFISPDGTITRIPDESW